MSECVLEFGRRTTFTHTTQGWIDVRALRIRTRHSHRNLHTHIHIYIHLLCTEHSNATHYFLTLSSMLRIFFEHLFFRMSIIIVIVVITAHMCERVCVCAPLCIQNVSFSFFYSQLCIQFSLIGILAI